MSVLAPGVHPAGVLRDVLGHDAVQRQELVADGRVAAVCVVVWR